jgi:hypothetical protein
LIINFFNNLSENDILEVFNLVVWALNDGCSCASEVEKNIYLLNRILGDIENESN